jgi:hypothetical protein
MSNQGDAGWVGKSGKKEVRPRILHSDRMVVFSALGTRDELFPDLRRGDGFDAIDHCIYVAGPEDLKPENNARLKATLLEKYAQAEAMPVSVEEKKAIQQYFLSGLNDRMADTYAIPLIRHFSDMNSTIREHYLTRKTMDQVKKGHFSHFDFINSVKEDLGMNDEQLYRHLQELFTRSGKKTEFEAAERKAAESVIAHQLRDMPIGDEEKNRIVRDVIKIRQEGGRQRIAINTKPFEELHRRLIRDVVAHMDTHIQDARNYMAGTTAWEGVDPFSPTADEKKKAEEIHAIAHREGRARPVVLAGYAHPDLTIILEKTPLGNHEGLSYAGQGLIRINYTCKQHSFDSTMREELLHQGMDRMYGNISLPYHKEQDNRKTLLEKAVAADNTNDMVFPALGFMREAQYNIENERDIHQEVPVKLLGAIDSHDWPQRKMAADPTGHGYEHLERFVTEVTIKDAIAYLQGQALPMIGDDYSRTPFHGAQAGQPRGGWAKGL